MKNFRTYQLAIQFNRKVGGLKISGYLKDQVRRAASSIALNLAEGSGRHGRKDQRKFFVIAMGSLRECQAVLDIEEIEDTTIRDLADNLGAHLYKLINS